MAYTPTDDQYLIDDEFRDINDSLLPANGYSAIDDRDGRVVIAGDFGNIDDIDFFGEDN